MEPPTTPPAGPPGPQQGPPYGAPQGPGYRGAPQGSGYPPGPGGYPPGPGYQPYPGSNEPLRRRTSVAAVLAFVFSLFAIIPVSVILGVVALARIPKTGDKGKGLAIAGLVLSGLWVAGIAAVIALAGPTEPDRDASGQVTATQDVSSNKLRVGDCVTEVKEGEVDTMKVQPCNQPNGGKVFAVFDLPAGKWPGLAGVQASAEKGCTDQYKATKQQASKPSDIWYLYPNEDSWSLGDRNITCLVAPR